MHYRDERMGSSLVREGLTRWNSQSTNIALPTHWQYVFYVTSKLIVVRKIGTIWISKPKLSHVSMFLNHGLLEGKISAAAAEWYY